MSSDKISVMHIKQELVETSSTSGTATTTYISIGPATSTCSPSNSNIVGSAAGSNSKTGSSTAAATSTTATSAIKSSPSVSPERQLCSSTTTLSSDLHSVNLNGDATTGNNSNNSTVSAASSIRDELRRLCLVCGDVASGFHYGVASCEACKAFFKRTIQGNIEYTCPANNECEINKRRRKACQACRFQKCLLMGMLKEGVRLDRVRGGRQKYRRNPVSNSYQTMQLLFQTSTSLDDIKILEVLNAYEPEQFTVQQQLDVGGSVNSSINREEQQQSSKSEQLSSKSPKLSCIFQNNNNDAQEILSVLSDLYDKELVGVIGWAKQIPGFLDLPLNDQMKLLQVSWAEILTLQLCFRSLPFSGKLSFASDVAMDEHLAKECGYTEFYYNCVQICQRLERLSPRREEYYLLKALLLSNCDILLDDQSALRAFRDTILNALNDVVYILRHSAAVSHQQQLLLLMPSLRQSDGIIRRFWRDVCHDEGITMKKLFVEMLEPVSR